MLTLKVNSKTNVNLFLIDEDFKPFFVDLLKKKRMLAFSLIKNSANEQVFSEILDKLKSFTQTSKFILNKEDLIKEVITESK